MTIHYAEAARRHHIDATYLFDGRRLPNADHLFGLAAECAMVAIIQTLDGTEHLFDENGEAKQPAEDKNKEKHSGAHLRKHVDTLWKSFWMLADKHDGKTTMHGVNRKANPFADWEVRQRYFADAHWSVCYLPSEPGRDTNFVEKHGDAARRLVGALQVALGKQTKKAARRALPEAAAAPEPAPEDAGGEARGDEEA
jgi:hypothetical protein